MDLVVKIWEGEKSAAADNLRSELADAVTSISGVLADLDQGRQVNPSALRRTAACIFEATRYAAELNTLTDHRLTLEDRQ